MQKAVFIIHGKLKRPDRIQTKIRDVFGEILQLEFKTTSKLDGAKSVTQTAVKEGVDVIVICGGDGSINEMVNGYFGIELNKDVVFGVLPMGTGNDFAKSLNVTKDLEQLRELILDEKYVSVDIFNMKFTDKNHKRNNRCFINISDIGIGGFVAEKVGESSKILGSNLTYVKAIVSSFVQYKKQPVTLTSDNFNWSGEVLSLCMANGRYFGSGMCIAPYAKLNDGKMQLTIFGDVSLSDYIKNLSKIKKGRKVEHAKVTYASATHCKIESQGQECPIDMDGEFIGYTPIEVNLHPHKMKFYSMNN